MTKFSPFIFLLACSWERGLEGAWKCRPFAGLISEICSILNYPTYSFPLVPICLFVTHLLSKCSHSLWNSDGIQCLLENQILKNSSQILHVSLSPTSHSSSCNFLVTALQWNKCKARKNIPVITVTVLHEEDKLTCYVAFSNSTSLTLDFICWTLTFWRLRKSQKTPTKE